MYLQFQPGTGFFNAQTGVVQKYLEYFRDPPVIFAFEEYDSGASYGYCLIYDGVLKRQFRSESYETTVDFGEPEAAELKWINAPIVREEKGEILFKHPVKENSMFIKDQLPQLLLWELMETKPGFMSWNIDEFIVKSAFFKRASLKSDTTGLPQKNALEMLEAEMKRLVTEQRASQRFKNRTKKYRDR